MSDIVDQLRIAVAVPICKPAADTIESLRQQLADTETQRVNWMMQCKRQGDNAQAVINELRQQLAEKDVEVDALRSHQENVEATHRITLRDVQKEAMRLQSENDALRQQLAASQAREQQFREMLKQSGMMVDAFFPPGDTTALQSMIAKAGDVALKRAISAASAINPIYGSGAAIDAISTVRIVTLEDLK